MNNAQATNHLAVSGASLTAQRVHSHIKVYINIHIETYKNTIITCNKETHLSIHNSLAIYEYTLLQPLFEHLYSHLTFHRNDRLADTVLNVII